MTRERQSLLTLFKKEGLPYAKNMLAMVKEDLVNPPNDHDKETYIYLLDSVIEEYITILTEAANERDKKFEKAMKKSQR